MTHLPAKDTALTLPPPYQPPRNPMYANETTTATIRRQRRTTIARTS